MAHHNTSSVRSLFESKSDNVHDRMKKTEQPRDERIAALEKRIGILHSSITSLRNAVQKILQKDTVFSAVQAASPPTESSSSLIRTPSPPSDLVSGQEKVRTGESCEMGAGNQLPSATANPAPQQETAPPPQPLVASTMNHFLSVSPPQPKHPMTIIFGPPITYHPSKAEVDDVKAKLEHLANPLKSLPLCLKLLTSHNWKDKVDGLKIIRALGRHHPEVLQTKLRVVCVSILDEVKDMRSVVACEAIDIIAELLQHMGKVMDPVADIIGDALLRRLAQHKNQVIHQQINCTLDILVDTCNPGTILRIVIKTGLKHLAVPVRVATARLLLQLMHRLGVDHVLTLGKTFSEPFVVAVSEIAVDAALEVRNYGQAMLEELTLQREFQALWDKLIPEKHKYPLNKIMKRLRK